MIMYEHFGPQRSIILPMVILALPVSRVSLLPLLSITAVTVTTAINVFSLVLQSFFISPSLLSLLLLGRISITTVMSTMLLSLLPLSPVLVFVLLFLSLLVLPLNTFGFIHYLWDCFVDQGLGFKVFPFFAMRVLGLRVTDMEFSGKYAWPPSVKRFFQLPMRHDALQLDGVYGLGLRPGEGVNSTTMARKFCLPEGSAALNLKPTEPEP